MGLGGFLWGWGVPMGPEGVPMGLGSALTGSGGVRGAPYGS